MHPYPDLWSERSVIKSIVAWLPAIMVVAVGFWTVGGSVSFAAEDAIEITEWVVPWENTRPRDPYVDGQGRVWFVGQVGNYLACLDPQTGHFKRYELDEGTWPHNLIVDDDGFVWYAGNRASHIGRLDPKTGQLTKHMMPDPAAGDPHTLIFDGNGDIWFTVQRGNFVGKLGTRTGSVDLIAVPTARARPYGIVVDGNNRAWFCELGTNKLATINPETLELEEVELPRADAQPRRLQVASDGQLWYIDYTGGHLGRLDPATGDIKEWLLPGGANARPYGMAIDDHDRLWFVETGSDPNRFIGFDPSTETFFSTTSIASGGGTVRHMYYHPPSREIWFGTDTNNIGRARVP